MLSFTFFLGDETKNYFQLEPCRDFLKNNFAWNVGNFMGKSRNTVRHASL